MHYLANDLINDNSISGVAFAFFSAITAGVSAIVVAVLQLKSKASEAKSAALEAKAEAEQAKLNTTNISNGFAGDMGRKLDRITELTLENNRTILQHLSWHTNNPPQERN